ncbi:sulfonate transport system substrate-binding protein [Acinetobacter calcoaceticus]|uniref:Putative aliphatic sulfonates-binding protein n=1 Tax=Acinetobacter calcoaceticus TaxID=471 RepID=A0A4R1XUG8_ACICA|nr:sulfonate transport system substrate-binding protein [Acinetobacter calcoaceticus]
MNKSTLSTLPKLAIAVVAIAILGLGACSKPTAPEAKPQETTNLSTLSIGYQKAALKLIVAKKNQFFEQQFPNVKIEWKEFPAGPQTLEALSVGAIDFGYTGDAPIIFALSAGKNLQYLGSEQGAKQSHAVLVPPNSPLSNIQALKGTRIALTRGSSAHYFLAETLKEAGLTWADIQPIWLSPADARAALDKKAVDAWVVWEPYISATEKQGNAKILFDSSNLPSIYTFYSAYPKFIQQHPQQALQVIEVLNKTDQWIIDHPQAAAEILAQSTGLDVDIAARVISKKPIPNQVSLLTPEVLKTQQVVADTFYDLKLIPNPAKVDTAAWNGKGSE